MRKNRPVDGKIEEIRHLQEWFWKNTAPLFVSTKIRREWLLNHKNIVVEGRVMNIDFKNMGGGVWEASLVELKPLK